MRQRRTRRHRGGFAIDPKACKIATQTLFKAPLDKIRVLVKQFVASKGPAFCSTQSDIDIRFQEGVKVKDQLKRIGRDTLKQVWNEAAQTLATTPSIPKQAEDEALVREFAAFVRLQDPAVSKYVRYIERYPEEILRLGRIVYELRRDPTFQKACADQTRPVMDQWIDETFDRELELICKGLTDPSRPRRLVKDSYRSPWILTDGPWSNEESEASRVARGAGKKTRRHRKRI